MRRRELVSAALRRRHLLPPGHPFAAFTASDESAWPTPLRRRHRLAAETRAVTSEPGARPIHPNRHPHLWTRPGVDSWPPVDAERWQMAGIRQRQGVIPCVCHLSVRGLERGRGAKAELVSGHQAAGTASPGQPFAAFTASDETAWPTPLRRRHRLAAETRAVTSEPGALAPSTSTDTPAPSRLGLVSTPGHPVDGEMANGWNASASGASYRAFAISVRREAGEGGEGRAGEGGEGEGRAREARERAGEGGRGVDATTQGPGRLSAEEPVPCRARRNRCRAERRGTDAPPSEIDLRL